MRIVALRQGLQHPEFEERDPAKTEMKNHIVDEPDTQLIQQGEISENDERQHRATVESQSVMLVQLFEGAMPCEIKLGDMPPEKLSLGMSGSHCGLWSLADKEQTNLMNYIYQNGITNTTKYSCI